MTYSATLPDTLDLAAIRARHTLLLLARLWQGNRARVDLARELGLSRSAISSIVTELMDARLVQEVGQRGGGQVGRRATLLALNGRAVYLLAVDLGARPHACGPAGPALHDHRQSDDAARHSVRAGHHP